MSEELKVNPGEGNEEKKEENIAADTVPAEKEESTKTDAAVDEVPEPDVKAPADPKEAAVSKLKEAEKKAGPSVKAIIEHLLKRCGESEALCKDIAKKTKTWDKCFNYIKDKARKQATNNCAVIKDDEVYEWAEDYFHMNDAEQEKKLEKGVRAKVATSKPEAKKAPAKTEDTANKAEKKPEEKKPEPKPKKKNNEIEGQMDMFSMFGLQEA